MREVDQALAVAYARRDGAGPRHQAVPPSPHLPPAPASATTPVRWPELVLSLGRTFADRFERLADVMVDAAMHQDRRLVWFTSGCRAEGRTTLVLTLARVLAERPVRTLLADADLTAPMLGRSLGLRPAVGFEDVVAGGRPLTDALVETPGGRLAVLPLRGPVASPRGFFAGPGWTYAAARLRREFALVLLDGGPMFASLGTPVLPPAMDAAVLVRRRAISGPAATARARDAMAAAGLPLLGVAETFATGTDRLS
jgi:Mrp family chromosome partitioning ATPase